MKISQESWRAADRVLEQVIVRSNWDEFAGEGWGDRIAQLQDEEDAHRAKLARRRQRSERVQAGTLVFLMVVAAVAIAVLAVTGVMQVVK